MTDETTIDAWIWPTLQHALDYERVRTPLANVRREWDGDRDYNTFGTTPDGAEVEVHYNPSLGWVEAFHSRDRRFPDHPQARRD